MNLAASSSKPATLTLFLLEQWLPNVKRTVRATTYESYSSHVRCHLIPALGEASVQELSPIDLNAFYERRDCPRFG